MTPAARHAAAAAILDRIGAGAPAEKVLTTWGRQNRYAGSGDRHAIRDLVYAILRRRRSCAVLGGQDCGRALVLGHLRDLGQDPATVFVGGAHGLAPLSEAEQAPPRPLTELEALDCPDWIAPALRDSLGADFAPVLGLMRHRADLFLRVNIARIDRPGAIARLAAEGIGAAPHPLAPTALRVETGARRVQQCDSYQSGLVEIQDAAAQAICADLPLPSRGCVLDYCAGGGGKLLALAARAPHLDYYAHDADPGRMRDLPVRAARAGVRVAPGPPVPADLVVADVPCSGTGAWRRQVAAKWALTPGDLADLCALQARILDAAAALTRPGGRLAHITCSLLDCENTAQVHAFLARHPGWHLEGTRRLTPLDGGDGFHAAVFLNGTG